MIFDNICNVDKYSKISERLKTAFDYLKAYDFSAYAPGRYDLDGDNLYFMIQIYTTKPKEGIKWENHRKYIDIQSVIDGQEMACIASIKSLTLIESYSDEKDVEFFSNHAFSSNIYLTPQNFAVYFPGDAHKPCIQCERPIECKKIVFKVKNI